MLDASNIPDSSVEFPGQTLHRQDHNKDSGKGRGGGLCAHVLQDNNSRITVTAHLESIQSIQCRCFHLPHRLTVATVTIVYNASSSLIHLQPPSAESRAPRAHPCCCWDFNKAFLKSLPCKFHQHVNCPSRGDRNRATPLPTWDNLTPSPCSLPLHTPPLRKQTPLSTGVIETRPDVVLLI